LLVVVVVVLATAVVVAVLAVTAMGPLLCWLVPML
jgi:hypothetical protein